MRRPTFLFIGPDKTGSTWLSEVLRRHPDCYVPPVKDIYFFDRYYSRGLAWYLDHFRHAPATARAIGEFSHDYLFSPQAAERIARDLPGVRLLTCLREPVARTFSHYLYMVRSGRTQLPFEAALEAFPELVTNSRYATHLEVYLRHFDRDRITVLWFDELVADGRRFARHVFSALQIPFVEGLPYDEKFLAAGQARSHVLARLVKRGAEAARDLGLSRLVGVVKRGPAQRLLYRRLLAGERPEILPDTRRRLALLFEAEIVRLERLLDVQLARWRDDGA